MDYSVWRRGVLLAAAVILYLSLLVFRPDHPGIWWARFFEWLHVPVFGLLSLVVLMLMPAGWSSRMRYVAALLLAVGLALASEAIQSAIGRSASLDDVVSDVIGAVSFLLLAGAFRLRILTGLAAGATSLALLVFSLLPVADVTPPALTRHFQFPVLFNGDVESADVYVRHQNVSAVTHWSNERGRMYAQIIFGDGNWPGLEFRNVISKWGEFSTLLLDLELMSNAPLKLTVRVHDRQHLEGNQPYGDRFNRTFTIEPGLALITIPLTDIEAAPRNRQLDLNEVEGFMLFTTTKHSGKILRLYEIRLY